VFGSTSINLKSNAVTFFFFENFVRKFFKTKEKSQKKKNNQKKVLEMGLMMKVEEIS